jgi:hypothetical protein
MSTILNTNLEHHVTNVCSTRLELGGPPLVVLAFGMICGVCILQAQKSGCVNGRDPLLQVTGDIAEHDYSIFLFHLA